METNPTRWQWLAAFSRQSAAFVINGRLTGRWRSAVAAAVKFLPSAPGVA